MKTLTYAFLVLAFVGLIWIFFSQKATKSPQPQKLVLQSEMVVNMLEKLAYFDLAEPEHKDSLMADFEHYYIPESTPSTIWREEDFFPLCYRKHFCDGEAIFQKGGFLAMLNTLKPTFDKIGFSLTIDGHFEEWDTQKKWLNHRISLNGTEYVIFKNFNDDNGWGVVVQRLVEILNTEFEKQGVKERIYLIFGGKHGSLIFLTKEQYRFMYSIYTNPRWKPLSVDEWIKGGGLNPMDFY